MTRRLARSGCIIVIVQKHTLLGKNRINVGQVLGRQRPFQGFYIGRDLLGAGRAGDDAGDYRLRCEPGESKVRDGMAALYGEVRELR